MGTRAMILKDGEPFIATHWDGYPSCLGVNLFKTPKTIKGIIKVAKQRTIDFAHSEVIKYLNDERIKKLAKKHNLSEKEIRKGKRRGCLMSAEDWEIGNVDDYGDFAEYEYNVDTKNKKVFVRGVCGIYGSNETRYGKQIEITKENIDKIEELVNKPYK